MALQNKTWMTPALFILSLACVLLFIKVSHGSTQAPPKHTISSLSIEELGELLVRQVNYDKKVTPDELSLPVTDEGGHETNLLSILNTGPKLVFRFTELDCDECVMAEMKRIDKLIDIVGRQQVLYLVSYTSNHGIHLLKRNYGIRGLIYNVPLEKMQDWDIEKLTVPYYFMADKNGAHTFFFPDKMLPSLSDIYCGNVKLSLVKYLAGTMRNDQTQTSTRLHFRQDSLSRQDLSVNGKAFFTFRFVNTGKSPLWISNVTAGCDCVEAEWPRYAVAPDDSAAIRIQYSPAEAGVFGRKIQVFGNIENGPAELVISGNVVDK